MTQSLISLQSCPAPAAQQAPSDALPLPDLTQSVCSAPTVSEDNQLFPPGIVLLPVCLEATLDEAPRGATATVLQQWLAQKKALLQSLAPAAQANRSIASTPTGSPSPSPSPTSDASTPDAMNGDILIKP